MLSGFITDAYPPENAEFLISVWVGETVKNLDKVVADWSNPISFVHAEHQEQHGLNGHGQFNVKSKIYDIF